MNGGLLQMDEKWGEMPPSWCAYIAVADADATIADVEQAGGSVVVPAFDMQAGRMGGVMDDQGAFFYVIKTSDPA